MTRNRCEISGLVESAALEDVDEVTPIFVESFPVLLMHGLLEVSVGRSDLAAQIGECQMSSDSLEILHGQATEVVWMRNFAIGALHHRLRCVVDQQHFGLTDEHWLQQNIAGVGGPNRTTDIRWARTAAFG